MVDDVDPLETQEWLEALANVLTMKDENAQNI